MDAAVVTLIKNSQDLSLQYAGAMNPLYYVQDGELKQIKGTKLPVGGKFEGDKTFELHEITGFSSRPSRYSP